MANEYRKTMNLPKTGFPMRAGLAANEPKRLKAWQDNHVYEQQLKKNEGHDVFVLHDGPPYANGPIHIGHAMNKISKDFINRYWMMQGKSVRYVPGWDCHGQPIEHKVETELGTERFNSLSKVEIRRLCREYAVENIDVQREGFKRLGVLGDWDHPYLTFYPVHDAADIQVFKEIYDKGAIYRGRKPVHWCKHCHTALAEAEIEYGDETSPSIYVLYRMDAAPKGLEAFEGACDVMIWTTTPWTLPANAAVVCGPDMRYVALVHEGRAAIVADALKEKVCETVGWELELATDESGEPWHATGEELEQQGLTYAHPIFEGEKGRFITGDFVGTDEGTGVVHTAPGHGIDDYNVGVAKGIPVIMPVDDDGRYYKGDGLGTGGPFSGMDTDEANPKIIEWLRERGTLVAAVKITHSYPHCWRCKNPVIFRATDQWFVSMDKTGLRDEALDAIDNKVKWYPAHASKRIGAMVAQRPDWCISRQRNWGVPIPAFVCADCGEIVMNDDTLDRVIELFQEKGSDAWYSMDPSEYLGDACVCPKCGSHNLKPGRDILDVWWDSGVSHTAVLKGRDELRFPADVYLEGSDQHRGWFQSSLLTSIGAYGVPPYKAVVSQGFTLDGQGRKMSKSIGNVIDPNEVCSTRGADIVRLWVASVDTSNDVAVDNAILDRVGDAYRRFRNTFRFLLGELEGQFDPERDAVPLAEMLPNDRLAVARMCQVHDQVSRAYADYRFNAVYRLLYDYVVTDLSNVYLNATKDRTYCEAADSKARRSAQTAWAHILEMMLHDLQPILAFTCDEVMAYLPASMREGQEYAALLGWYEAPMAPEEWEPLAATNDAFGEVRGAFTRSYEELAATGALGEKASTQAVRARLTVPAELFAALSHDIDLAELLVCSEVELAEGEELACEVEPAHGERCPRCWNWRTLGADGLCPRCHEAVAAAQAAGRA
ncbi:MAG: isoleucine--tRNA ligase [Atopobiaceae bacterium]|nr:isoleucine--tRNA ligase [Atopobiaceae bacterium]MCH4120486.1 isoleucine--tRNA ligase [Atopobiaceae bacterium]MCI1318152.1 isoleucine--tRNA ligase [Atopobiaceae bacterium]MCI1388324.1 isoleucine--tRNA ligase [Atopobiaceae bacterium]MCI1431426.1 isoleucine--tRNA ligase [Atopobiaceae bacterium]